MNYHISRQPIFNKTQAAYAYDLLLRTDLNRSGAQISPTHDAHSASVEVIANSTLLGDLKEIACGKKVLINVSRDVLEGDYVYALPKKVAIVSLDASIIARESSLTACRKLRDAGYQIALNNNLGRYGAAFVDFAALVKIDFADFQQSAARRAEIEHELRLFARAAAKNPALQLIGSGLETKELYHTAYKSGCALFQGDYFVEPERVSGRDIQAFKLPFLQLLREIHQEDVAFPRVERAIKQDVALTYKLLRFVNSAAVGRREEVKSIQSALGLLGENDLKRWVTLAGVSGLAQGKPKELLAKALMRARFCESLAAYANLARYADDLFLMGLFSLLDVLLDRPLADILKEVPLSAEIKRTLLGEETSYVCVYDCMLAYERGRWDAAAAQAATLEVEEAVLPAVYLASISWVNQQIGSEAL